MRHAEIQKRARENGACEVTAALAGERLVEFTGALQTLQILKMRGRRRREELREAGAVSAQAGLLEDAFQLCAGGLEAEGHALQKVFLQCGFVSHGQL